MNILTILVLLGCLALGLVVGGAYFRAMWWSAELFATGERVPTAIALVAGRFALMLAILATVAIRGGALPLLATAAGIALARIVAVRRVKAMAP
ncbi:MAG: ATP synthase subunit I [Sphingomonas sp.]